MTGLMWVPYILDRMMVRGMMGTLANPTPTDKPQSPWAQRLMAAHVNAVENLVIFAPLVLAAQDLNVNLATPTTTFACQLYFWSRLTHAVTYTLGIPVLRTLAFVGGFCRAGHAGAGAVQVSLTRAQGNSATCSSPIVSGKPSIRFMFCTAWPDAPLVSCRAPRR